MKILFITSTRIGDAILSTGALDYLVRAYPQSRITVACGPLVTEIFEAAPNVVSVIALKKEPYGGHWRKLAQKTLWQKWDIVVDLRNSFLSRILLSRKKYIWHAPDDRLHKVEQIAGVIGVQDSPPAPRLWLTAEALKKADQLIPNGGSIIAVAPSANWPAKTWPAERFSALLARMTSESGLLPGAKIAVIAAPGEEENARKVLNSLKLGQGIDVIAKTSPLGAAAVISKCDFYVGNDSGLTHAASAVGVPTLGLFGPSWPHLYSPWGEKAAYVSTPENFDQLTSFDGYNKKKAPCLMTTLSVDMAYDAAKSLWQKISR